MSKAVVPISGGLDSAVILSISSAYYDKVYTISYDYGQKHKKELLYAEMQIDCYDNIEHHNRVDLSFFKNIVTSSSITNNNIPVAHAKDVLGDAQTVNYVPFRNMMMLSIACSYAEAVGAETVYHGAALVDSQAGYWDGSKELVDTVNQVTDLNREKRITIEAPLLNMSKAAIVKEGLRLGVKYGDTWTCYSNRKDGLADATTPSSSMRVKGFIDAGYEDPIRYVQQEKLDNLYKDNKCKECA